MKSMSLSKYVAERTFRLTVGSFQAYESLRGGSYGRRQVNRRLCSVKSFNTRQPDNDLFLWYCANTQGVCYVRLCSGQYQSQEVRLPLFENCTAPHNT